MFKSIDILIGLSVIMLVASMAVTMITQAIIAVSGSRGRNLLAGLVGMIEQLDPGFSKRHAQEIVKMILTHQAVNGGTSFGIVRYGDVIHREELTKILLELASKAETPDQKITKIQQQALRALKNTMAANGIVNPEQTLDNVRLFALQLEKSSPEMASNVRHNIALMRYAPSQFLAKINSRFDSIIDRVSDRFTFNARILAFLSATLVAVALQLDTIMLVNRLAMDESTRTAIVQAAIDEVQSKENNNLAENPSGQSAATAPESVKVLYRSLANEGILVVPKIGEWSDSWKNVNPAGVFLSILLLSLGAPFWYGALGKLLQLRSLLARKDDVERVLRQSTQEAGKSATPVAQSMPPMPSNKSATAAAPSSPTDSTALTAAKAAVNAAKVAESKAQSAMTAIDEINVKLDQLLKKKSD
ncbi:hypothetical protein Nit79A3_3307 [Nitrosomonas sp. Is79A3]|uniref:hypothetical protein n=1 Tax=Nitrosomonas sp. (strain Is79A3) TaxID=261292 RepID=UPI000215D12E